MLKLSGIFLVGLCVGAIGVVGLWRAVDRHALGREDRPHRRLGAPVLRDPGRGGRPWAVKQGWSCCGPTRMLHTSGLVGDDDRYIVAVLSEHPASVDYATASKRVTSVVSAALG